MKKVLFVLAIGLAGCKTLQNTPQEYTEHPQDKWEIERELETEWNHKY